MAPFLRADTGLSSIRLDVSAARRMSASPMVRTFSAWAAKPGLPTASVLSAVEEAVDLGVQLGHHLGGDLWRHLGRGGLGDGLGCFGGGQGQNRLGRSERVGSGAAAWEPSVVMRLSLSS